MSRVQLLTRSILRRLEPPKGRGPGASYYIMEVGGRGSLGGFGVRVQRRSASYVVRLRGNPHIIGRIDRIPLEQARELARSKLFELASESGAPSLGGRRKTLAELGETYLERVVAPKNKPTTLANYRLLWRVYLLPRLGGMQLGSLTPEVVLNFKHELREHPVVANRALQQLSAALAFAVKLGWIGRNPADRATVERFPERPRTRSLDPEEYRRLGAALRHVEQHSIMPGRTVAAIRLLLLTGARPQEILSAEQAWLELGTYPRLKLPEAKGDRPGRRPRGRSIWLSPAALEVVRSIDRPPGCRWLIPGDDPSHPLGSIRKAWERVCRMAGIEGAPPKAARHAYRSAGPDAGVAPEHMRELMGHSSSKMTDEVYWHARGDAQAKAAAMMGEHLGQLLDAGGG